MFKNNNNIFLHWQCPIISLQPYIGEGGRDDHAGGRLGGRVAGGHRPLVHHALNRRVRPSVHSHRMTSIV